jgi:hypothetical protein
MMIQVATLSRSWVGVAWLLIAAGLLGGLAFGNTLVLFAMLAAAVVVGLVLLGGQAAVPASSRSAVAPVAGAASIGGAPRAQRSVMLADGAARQALLVPAAAIDGYQAVLTVDGYALVNAEGRIVYALSREAPASASEPVMVTILDAESVAI